MRLLGNLFAGQRGDWPDLAAEDMQNLAAVNSADEAAAICLELLSRYLMPKTAYAYLWSPEEQQYRLVCSLAAAGTDEPEPDYSGLLKGATGVRAPLSLSAEEAPPCTEVVEQGGSRWLVVPLGAVCLMRVRFDRFHPIRDDVVARVGRFAAFITPALVLATRVAQARAEADRHQSSLQAARMASEAVLRPERSLEMLFRLPMDVLGATDGALVVVQRAGESPRVAAASGRGDELCGLVLDAAAPALLELPAHPDLATGEDLGTLSAAGVKAVIRIPAIHGTQARGCAYYFLTGVPELDPYRLAVLATLGDRLAQVIGSSQLLSDTTDHYVDTLRALVTAMDATMPYTAGHSDRMARYARMIARELGLGAEEEEAVALGAYLHDVGMVALDLNLINTAGRLTPDQYEDVKQHPGLGSELVTVVAAALPVAPMVAHHHERWDGRGYPHRLRGEETPLGARIIAVCDLFEAKTTGRPYRKPLPFARALGELEAAAGTHLDPSVVTAFVRSWTRLRAKASAGLPASPCWTMKQMPATICGACPNRSLTSAAACWEAPENLCVRHGDDCASCIVYTEALTRALGGA